MAAEIEAKIREHTIAKLVSAESGVSDAEPVVQELNTEQEAYDYALDILSYRDYSRKDMELKLKRKGADAVIIKSTIQKLLEYGFLDEKR